MDSEMEVNIIHKKCFGIAFRYSEIPSTGALIESQKAILKDGSHPKFYDPMICESCGRSVSIEDLIPESGFIEDGEKND